MQVELEKGPGLEYTLKVQIPAEQIDGAVAKRLKEVARSVRLPGFRPGKIPMQVIQQRFGGDVWQEVLSESVNSTLTEALQQHQLEPAGSPNIEPLQLEPGHPIEYRATFEVYPDLPNPDLNQLEVRRPSAEITEDDVAATIDRIREQRASWVNAGRPAEIGDRIIADFRGAIDGQADSRLGSDNQTITLGKGELLADFERLLLGMSTGDERSGEVTFPSNYGHAELANQSANFHVVCRSVLKAQLPEIDNAFATSLGIEDGSLETLYSEVRQNMEQRLNRVIRHAAKQAVMNALLEQLDPPLPTVMVKAEIESLTGQGQQGDLETEARRRVALGLIIGTIIRKQSIALDPNRVQALMAELITSSDDPNAMLQQYNENDQLKRSIESLAMEDTVVEHILSQAQIIDVPSTFDELVKGDAAAH